MRTATTIRSLTASPRETWCAVTYPQDGGPDWPYAIFKGQNGERWPAVRGRDLGTERRIYWIRAATQDDRPVSGVLESSSGIGHFTPHPWVVDNVPALLPSFIVVKNGTHYAQRSMGLFRAEASAAHERWIHRADIAELGFVIETALTIKHLDPVVDLETAIIWSTRKDPEPDYYVDGIYMKTGELPALDDATRNGIGQPKRIGMEWWTAIAGPIGFIDGSGLPITGRLCCFLQDLSHLPAEPGELERNGIRDLIAGMQGPVLGVCTDQDGAWIGHGNVPRLVDGLKLAEREWQAHLNRMQFNAGWYAQRPLGNSKLAGSTGAQEDFGACKGTFALLGDPRHIDAYRYSALGDFFRGTCLYEDSQPMEMSAHPQLWMWDGYRHWNRGVSPDRIGKREYAWGERGATGWSGYDDQHRGQQNLVSYYALSGSYLAQLMLEHQSRMDSKMLMNRLGAPRAVGRLAGFWSKAAKLGIEVEL